MCYSEHTSYKSFIEIRTVIGLNRHITVFKVPTVLENSLNFGFSWKLLENENVFEKSLNLGDLP